MNTWCHLPTNFKHRSVLRYVALLSIAVAFITTLIFAHVTSAAVNTSRTISFQGRLQTATGAVVPDGHYNIQFKIYQGGTGISAGNPGGTLNWTETYINNGNATGAVQVKNGYFAVELGSKTAFGSSVDWDSDTLWLSMNVAGKDTACTTFGTSPCAADGEMLPMKRITATPYAVNAGAVGGRTAADLVQLGQGVQTDANNGSSIFLNKTGTGNFMQLQASGNDALTINTAGNITMGSVADQSITVATASSGAGKSLTLSAGDSATGSGLGGGNLVLQGGSGDGAGNSGSVIVKTNATDTSGTFQVQKTDGVTVFAVDTVDSKVRIGTLNFMSDPVGSSTDMINSTQDLTITSTGAMTIGPIDDSLSLQGASVGVTSNAQLNLQGSATTVSGSQSLSLEGDVITIGDSETTEITVGRSTITTTIASDTLFTGTSNTFKATGNSPTAFQVQETSGAGLFTINSTNKRIRIGTGWATANATLLILDKATTAPTATDHQAFLGSMYYDTTIGKLQCYEEDGWGACSSAPDTFVSLDPEYAGMVTNNSGTGVLSTGFCSDELNILDGSASQATICGTNETQNFYKWTTGQGTSQTRATYVTYQLPASFKNFISGSTSLMGRTDHANSSISYQLYKKTSSGLTSCGSATSVSTGIQSTWQKGTASGSADPSTCSFAAGDSLLIRIELTAQSNSNAYISTLKFAFNSQ